MDQLDIAVHQTLLKAPGGAERLAGLMGKNSQVLRNECNPNNDQHKLGLRDAVAMMMNTGDAQILNEIARMLGYTVEPMAARPGKDLLHSLLAADKEHGDIAQSIRSALDDGKITPREAADIRTQIGEAREALDGLLGSVVLLEKEQRHG